MEPTKSVSQLEVASLPPLTELEIGREPQPITRLERVAIAYPSGNTTAIVFDQLSGYNPKTLNHQIMQAWALQQPGQPEIEQCAIVTMPQDADAVARVQMLGGEFCGNATRSALWSLAGGQRRTGLVEVSGVNRPLIFNVRDKEVRLQMPLSLGDQLVRQASGGLLVQLDGIMQFVADSKGGQTTRQVLEELLGNPGKSINIH